MEAERFENIASFRKLVGRDVEGRGCRSSETSFFRDCDPATKQLLAFTTRVQQLLLAENSEENPLSVIVVLPPKEQPTGK